MEDHLAGGMVWWAGQIKTFFLVDIPQAIETLLNYAQEGVVRLEMLGLRSYAKLRGLFARSPAAEPRALELEQRLNEIHAERERIAAEYAQKARQIRSDTEETLNLFDRAGATPAPPLPDTRAINEASAAVQRLAEEIEEAWRKTALAPATAQEQALEFQVATWEEAVRQQVRDEQTRSQLLYKLTQIREAGLAAIGRDFVQQVEREWAEKTKTRLELLELEKQAAIDKAFAEIANEHTLQQTLTRIEELYTARRLEIEKESRNAAIQHDLAALDARRELLEQDVDLDYATRRSSLLEIYQREVQLIGELTGRLRELAAASPDESARLQAAQQVLDLERRRAEILLRIRDLQRETFGGALYTGLRALYREVENLGLAVANTLTGQVRHAISEVSYAIWDVVDGTRTWGQVFLQIGRNIVSGIISVMAQWMAARIALFALEKALGATATGLALAQATALSAAWTPAAVAASIATMGGAAAAGFSAYTAAQGAAMAQRLAVAATPFAEGGVVRKPTLALVGERGTEYILNDAILRRLATMLQPRESRPLNIVLVDDRTRGHEALKTAAGRAIILDLVQSGAGTLGLRL